MSLFHYTNIQAIQSILTNQKIWLTDIRFLNDSAELHNGLNIFLHELKNLQNISSLDKKYIKDAIEYIDHTLSDTINLGIEEDPFYVFSLGTTKDRLSQWRTYGNYAIEFDEANLKEFIPILHTCNYDDVSKHEIAKNTLLQSLEKMCLDINTDHGCFGISGQDAIENIVEKAATFKHTGFFEEEEVRVISQLGQNTIQYRTKNNMLIPYLELPISLDCIKCIHIAPSKEQDLAFQSMLSFAKQIESEWQIETGNIEYWLQVETSEIPYRG
ncbi:MAG TPA: DUF2971 domain-containing protein [Sulfuricurvum sp.]|nr:DUF2971 domain-containing protein [Sulfuricurvum sp.]